MLLNEVFALACRAYYDEQGLIVDARNGQFAHCPYPKGMGETGYYLLWEHHQQQGLLQSRDLGKCCFFPSDAKKWLENCESFPDHYFELWDIYEEFASLLGKKASEKAHSEKDELGRSLHAVRTGKMLNSEKDKFGRSVNAVKAGQISGSKKHKKVRLIRNNDGKIYIFHSIRSAARVLQLDHRGIINVCKGKGKTVGGYTAAYWDG